MLLLLLSVLYSEAQRGHIRPDLALLLLNHGGTHDGWNECEVTMGNPPDRDRDQTYRRGRKRRHGGRRTNREYREEKTYKVRRE